MLTEGGFLFGLLHNAALISAVLAWCAAQGSKIVYETIRYGFSLKRLTGAGGMPSTHSSTVAGLAVGVLFHEGAASGAFAAALFFAGVVIYDAMGVRYETGRQAKALNRLRERDLAEGKQPLYDAPMEEKIGHTLPEVIVGTLLGIAVGFLVCGLGFGLTLHG